MTDRELLERAAKAAGYEYKWIKRIKFADGESLHIGDDRQWIQWNPLDDDGDALRLAVKLRIRVECDGFFAFALRSPNEVFAESVENCGSYAATRRAIVRAAAELRKGAE